MLLRILQYVINLARMWHACMMCYILVKAIASSTAETITLSRDGNITCVMTESSAESAVYLEPPVNTAFGKSSTELDNWNADDWAVKSSLDSNQAPVTDKRWEDFQLFDEDTGFAVRSNLRSFSIWNPGNINFRVMDEDNFRETTLNFTTDHSEHTNGNYYWSHYSLLKENNDLHVLFQGKKIASYKLDFTPYWIYFRSVTLEPIFWKLHNYSFRVADTVTQSERSSLYVNLTENVCLSMYVSVDEGCFLDIKLKTDDENVSKKVIGFNKKSSFRKWQKIEISATYPGQGKLTFFRGRQQQEKADGFWAIDDVTFCSQETEVYHAQFEEQSPHEYICQTLNAPSDKTADIEPNVISCEEPGFLGTNCNVSCESVLGKAYPYCEGHRICRSDSTCFCSSGYHGENCQQTCAPGTWGLFCENKCESECEKCHSSTGKCLDEDISESEIAEEPLEIEQYSQIRENNSTGVSEIEMKKEEKLENFTDQDLPLDIALKSNEIYIHLPNDKTITYDIKYLCVSHWCKNDIIEEDIIAVVSNVNFTNPVKRIFKSLSPFTEYQPIVNVRNHNLNKKYGTIKAETRNSLGIQNLSIYCSNATILWIKFQIPDMANIELSQYKIWYQQRDTKTPPRNISEIYRCKLWNTFICGRINDLEADTAYSIIIEGTKDNTWALSSTLEGFTAEKEPQAPENLALTWSSSSDKAIITWDYPSITNGPLQNFVIETSSGEVTNTYTVKIEEPQKTYKYEIPVQNRTEYSISVHGNNKYVGHNSKINAYFNTNPDYSPKPSIEVCSPGCYLLIPKPTMGGNERGYHVMITKADEKSKDPDIVQSLKNGSVLTGKRWLLNVTEDYSEDYLNFEIDNVPKDFSLKNDGLYTVFLILSDESNQHLVYNINNHHEETVLNLATTSLIIIPPVVLLLLLLSLLILLRKLQSRNGTLLPFANKNVKNDGNINKHHEQEKLNPNKNLKESFTKVEVRYLENYVKAALLTGRDLVQQFRSLPVSTRPIVHAFQNKNKNKNRDREYVTYDCSRVVLDKMEGMGTDDYINASYINGLYCPKVYIATQGPKFSTIRDFWRMVWQERVQTIVMATNFLENKQRKCAEYFPQMINTIFDCGAMAIKLTTEERHEHYDYRVLNVYYKKSMRRVQHFHLKWNPDDMTPLYADRVVPLIKRMSVIREKSTTPIVVHCSSGTNRTGTLVLCDLALEMAKSENCVDFYTLIKNMRDQRPNMICSEKQYILAHLIVLECLLEPPDIFKTNLEDNLNLKILKSQLNYLDKLCDHDKMIQLWTPQYSQLSNCPVSHCLVDGYARSRKYLVMQQPPKSSLFDFWNIVIREKIRMVVFLDEAAPQIWPYQNQTSRIVFTVKEMHSVKTNYCKSTKLLLLTSHAGTGKIIFEHAVFFLQMKAGDKKNNLPEIDNFLDMVDDVHKNCHHLTPTLVACNDGITSSGLFVTMSYIIEKYQKELETDIFNGIRTVRRSGAKFIKTREEMAFLYKALSEHIRKFDTYTSVLQS